MNHEQPTSNPTNNSDGWCDSCDGFGDHGVDEDGCLYVCYGCGGTGKAPSDKVNSTY